MIGLLADSVMKGLDPNVETRKGAVQLSDFVENQAQVNAPWKLRFLSMESKVSKI